MENDGKVAEDIDDNQAEGSVNEYTTISTKEMAILLGITVRRVQQLIQDGLFKTQKKGRLLLIECVRSYLDQITDKTKTADERKLEKAKAAAEVKFKVAKAAMAELQAKELSGKMHRSEDTQVFTQGLIDMVKSSLLQLPGRLAVDLSLCETAEECSILIKDAVKDILREVSEFDYDPEKYEALVRERQNLDEKQEEEDEE